MSTKIRKEIGSLFSQNDMQIIEQAYQKYAEKVSLLNSSEKLITNTKIRKESGSLFSQNDMQIIEQASQKYAEKVSLLSSSEKLIITGAKKPYKLRTTGKNHKKKRIKTKHITMRNKRRK
jgi:hypothetical protein